MVTGSSILTAQHSTAQHSTAQHSTAQHRLFLSHYEKRYCMILGKRSYIAGRST